MSEVAEKPKPVMTSSVAAVKAMHDAKNAAQKADLVFQTPEAAKKLTKALEALQQQYNQLRDRVEALEAKSEDGPVL